MATEEPLSTTNEQTTQIRINRGATIMAMDGALGTVHQIIMDQRTGELQALVIATGGTEYLELPATHVLRATGSDVYLDVSQADLRQQPELAKPYNPNQYVPVRENPFLPPSEATRGAQFSERPVVTNIERDAVGVVVPKPATPAEDIVTSMTTPEAERYVTEPRPVPAAPPVSSEQTGELTVADTHVREGESSPPDEPTVPLSNDIVNERTGSVASALDAEAAPATPEATSATPEPSFAGEDVRGDVASFADISDIADVTDVASIADITDMTDVADVGGVGTSESVSVFAEEALSGVENATEFTGIEMDFPRTEEEEAVSMEGSIPPVNPVNPGVTSETIQHNQDTIPEVLNESQESHTHTAPPGVGLREWDRQRLTSLSSEETGNRLTWAPAVALGALIVGVAAWSAMRAIRRGRRKAAKAAKTARANVRGSMRDAGKSAVELAQTMRASALEMAASPREAATDALSNFADIPARYRWFRRGVRVGARAPRLRGR